MQGPKRLKLLAFVGDRPTDDDVLNQLRTAFDVDLVREVEEAHAALRQRDYDMVVAATSDFLPLERGLAGEQATIVLNTIGEGVCVVSHEGQLTWANEKLKGFDPAVIDQVVDQCRHAAQEFAAGTRSRNRRFSLLHGESFFDAVCSPVRDREGRLTHVAAVVFDATAMRQSQQKMDAIDQAGRELARLGGSATRRMTATERLQFIEDRVIRYTRDLLQYDHFALYVVDERSGRLDAVASMGMPPEARGAVIHAREEGNGIAGYVAATGRSYLCRDVTRDPRYRSLGGLTDARSNLTVPLRLQDRVIGVLRLESHHEDAFDEQDRQFAEILANYTAMALNTLNLLTAERYCATSEITGVVTAELAGPLNDILAETQTLMDEYIGHDEMRRHLQRIIERVEGIRSTVRQIADVPRTGILDSAALASEPDPVLGGRRVLVADDEDLIRQTIHDVLERYGAMVDTAANGAEAERMIHEGDYELVLSDIKMPHRNGYDVFAAAKARNAATAVILITGFGYDPNHSIVRAHREGLAAVLFKPFKVNQLLDEVRGALTR